jgi:hypothetical protein
MLMLLATATAEGIDAPKEELWFTHVSFLLLREQHANGARTGFGLSESANVSNKTVKQ